MPTTTKHALRYPQGSDSADVPRDIENLADDVDGKMATWAEAAIGSRPSAGTSGRWFQDTTIGGLVYVDDGAEWRGMAEMGRSTWASIPAPGREGRLWYVTDRNSVYVDHGAAWGPLTKDYSLGQRYTASYITGLGAGASSVFADYIVFNPDRPEIRIEAGATIVSSISEGWRIQYKIGSGGTWTDVVTGTQANGFAFGAVNASVAGGVGGGTSYNLFVQIEHYFGAGTIDWRHLWVQVLQR